MIAHIREKDKEEQSVSSHCQETADSCAGYAGSINAVNIGKLQGLLHDVGKLTKNFEKYIRQEASFRRGEIDHSYAGAKYLCELAERTDAGKYESVAKLIARTILSHHGIHDWLVRNESEWRDYVLDRLGKDENYDEVLEHIGEVVSDDRILQLLDVAANEYRVLSERMKKLANKTSQDNKVRKKSFAFYKGMLERFLQSCLIDADRTNTADFMYDAHTEKTIDVTVAWETMADRMRKKYETFAEKADNTISRQRCNISDRCADFAQHPVGACRLIVPTGGGKTLSSLRFAINYCRRYGKKKILYTAPYMSILEQNSDVLREIVGEEYFTEHHSNILAELETREELCEYELRTEKWDMPVIATTMVQLLNTLFSGKISTIRRMHRLAESVLIIDEVQSIPLKCVHLFNLAINFLTHICGTTVVLCSATQPAVEQTEFPLLLDESSSMTGDTSRDFEVFRRTEIVPEVSTYGFSYEEAADFCENKFSENGNLLLIVNTKAAAKMMFEKMKSRCPEAVVMHLSTNLCPAHRRTKIEEMKKMLEPPCTKPLICVTTQLIEAGVDISFRCVVRSLAGLDNIAQAAGRCNRNGESLETCPVYVIKLKEEFINRLEGMQTAQLITQQMIDSTEVSDYLSQKTQNLYFQLMYQRENGKLSYPVKYEQADTDLVELLSLNRNAFKMSGLSKDLCFSVQAFKTAGSLFQVIDSKTQDVIVPYNDEAKAILEELDSNVSAERYRELRRIAQKFVVSIYEGQKRALSDCGAVRILQTGVIALEERFYDKEDYGVTTEGAEMELLIF